MAFTDQIPAGPGPQGAQPRLPMNEADPEMMDESEAMDPMAEEQEEPAHAKLLRWMQSINIAEEIAERPEGESELSKIGSKVIREFEIDDGTREDWLEENKEAFDLAMQVAEEKTHPWQHASNVVFPLLTVAAIQFAARAYPAIVSGRNVVKGVVVGTDKGTPKMGPDGSPEVPLDPQTGGPVMGPNGQPQINWAIPPGEKRRRADRIAGHMSWQLLDEMESWEEDTDKLLHILPIAGCCFRKSYFDPGEGCNVSELASARNVVINYWAKSMSRAPRISERVWFYPNEIEENERAGIWLEQEYGTAVPSGDDEKEEQSTEDTDSPHEFIEQHRRLDLDGDGYSEPYVVTVHRATSKVVRIIARYDPDGVKLRGEKVVRIAAIDYYTKYDFLPNPEGGIYGIGFGKLLMPLNDSVNTLINQLIDAGTLANTATGFIGRGLSMHSGSVKFKMGEFKVVNAPGSRIKEAIVPLNFPEPSTVLFSLLGLLIEAAKEVASIKDVLTGEGAATMSPTTMMGLIDQGLKVFTGIYKRVHRSAKKEFDKLYRLNRLYMEDKAEYQDGDEWKEITREDYAKGGGVQPVSDPSMVSNMQKLARAELLRSHRGDPMVNQIEILRREFDAADIPDVESLIVEQQPENPEIIKQAAELEMNQAKSRSEEIKNYALAIKALADADKASADIGFNDARTQMDMLMSHFKMLTEQLKQPQAGAAPALQAAA